MNRDQILKNNPAIPPQALDRALPFLNHAKVSNHDHFTIVDFSQSDAKMRFHFINLKDDTSEDHKVAHGKNSDQDKNNIPEHFSNVDGTFQSSLGAMVIKSEFKDSRWKVVHLMEGLELGLNDHVGRRGIHWHSTNYVHDTDTLASGDTLGCFGMDVNVALKLNSLVTGTLLYAWHPSLEGQAQIPSPASGPVYREGSRGEMVKAIQGMVGATKDGIFGPQTTKLVKFWQLQNGLVSDGIVGAKTLAKMDFGKAPDVPTTPLPQNHELAPAIAIIKEFEGVFLHAYLDPVGIPTIGWGTIRYPNGQAVKMGDVITTTQAEEYLMNELNQFVKDVDMLVKVSITNNMFCALCSFAYNVGSDIDDDKIAEGLGDSTLLSLLNAGASKEQVAAEFPKWNKGGGKVLPGLVRRRAAEAKLFLS